MNFLWIILREVLFIFKDRKLSPHRTPLGVQENFELYACVFFLVLLFQPRLAEIQTNYDGVLTIRRPHLMYFRLGMNFLFCCSPHHSLLLYLSFLQALECTSPTPGGIHLLGRLLWWPLPGRISSLISLIHTVFQKNRQEMPEQAALESFHCLQNVVKVINPTIMWVLLMQLHL